MRHGGGLEQEGEETDGGKIAGTQTVATNESRPALAADVRRLRALVTRAGSLIGALGIFLVGGIIVAAVGTFLFAQLAEHVMAGSTQAFDEAALRWIKDYHSPALDDAMLAITALGTGTVVIVQVAMSSFPSGHAMSATIVYSTVAYLAARLQKRLWARWLTMLLAAVIIVMIAISRTYLGVHYPSDVLAGSIVGLSWAAFCMATLEAIQRFGQRQAPEIKKGETPAPALEKG